MHLKNLVKHIKRQIEVGVELPPGGKWWIKRKKR